MNKPNRCLKKLAADLAIKQVMLTHTKENIRHLRDIRSTVDDADLDVDTRGLRKAIFLCERFNTRLIENIDKCVEVFNVEPLPSYYLDDDMEWL
jgi:hypothetical protein